MRVRLLWCLAFVVAVLSVDNAAAQTSTEYVRGLVDQVDIDSLVAHVRFLSGEDSVTLNGRKHRITSREAYTDGNQTASEYIFKVLSRYHGMTVWTEVFHWDYQFTDGPWFPDGGTNVLAKIEATARHGSDSDDIYIISAHYDSRTSDPEGYAPGADDNASGTAVVLEAARILQHAQLGHTVIFALWDIEELHLGGSSVFSAKAALDDMPIGGVVNVDMVGYDGNNNKSLFVAGTAEQAEFAYEVARINERYDIGLAEANIQWISGGSDHWPFIKNGFPAASINTGWRGEEKNPGYHSKDDRIANFNLDTFRKAARMAVAAIAHLATGPATLASTTSDEIPSSETLALIGHFPNPVRRQATIAYELATPAEVGFRLYDGLGRLLKSTDLGIQPSGRHEMQIEVSELAAGAYFYRIVAGRSIQMKVLTVTK